MGKSKDRGIPEINAGSMADIAFLLLIFFLVTTTIATDKGVNIILPPKKEQDIPPVKFNERNLFKVIVNTKNQLLVDGEPLNISQLKETTKRFITNNGADPKSSESPDKAVITFKTDRGTRYDVYVRVLDELKGAYHELRTEEIARTISGFTLKDYLSYDPEKASTRIQKAFEAAKDKYPMQISEAEPSKIGG
ncbi:ExbD/TolR family protein [Eisenibacter elegans]|jgi:biopolymer transport protein ExbD|uniref:ExbD/TolR family protein n=1 Tax=Eisenibacter elegans TaxID=997 RepID=UPI000479C4F4|nr:biopolymer transporter ExbD [Eisenibacter elegans]